MKTEVMGSPTDDMPLLLTCKEAMEVFRINRNTLYALISQGKIHAIRIGRQHRIPRSAIEAMVNESSGVDHVPA